MHETRNASLTGVGTRRRDITGELRHVLDAAVPSVCSAAVALIAGDGEVIAAEASGELVRYADGMGTLLARRPPATRDSDRKSVV